MGIGLDLLAVLIIAVAFYVGTNASDNSGQALRRQNKAKYGYVD